jgi:hypothetical protein
MDMTMPTLMSVLLIQMAMLNFLLLPAVTAFMCRLRDNNGD